MAGQQAATALREQDSTSQIVANNPYKGYTWEKLQEVLVEKEYELECTRDSVGQLSVCKAENVRKDEIIALLRKELAAYKKNAWSKDISYVSMEEQLAACENHLQEKADKLEALQKELEELRGQLQATVCHSAVNQKKMTSTLTTMTQQARDVQQLQSQHKTDTVQLESLRQELTEKKTDMYSLQERVKRLRSMNQDLQKRLEDSQAQCENLIKNEQRLKAEVAQLKNHSSDGKLLQAKHDFVEQELAKNKEREKVTAVELGRLREELASLCENVSNLVSGNDSGGRQSPTTIISAVSKLAQEHSETNDKLTTITQQLEELERKHLTLCVCIDSLQQSWTECKGVIYEDPLSGINTLITKLQGLQSQDYLKDFLVIMHDVLLSIHSSSSTATISLSQLTDKINISYSGMDGHDSQESDPVAMVSFMSELIQSTLQEAKQLKQKLCESEIEHSAALSGAVTALRHDEEARLSSKVENMRQQEKVQYSHQIEKMKQECETERKAATKEIEARTEVMKAELENLQQLYDAQLGDNKLLKEELIGLELKLQDEDLKQKEELATTESQKEELRQHLFKEVTAYKEQSEQYAATIVALEDKLLELMDRCKSLQNENVELADKLTVETTTCQNEVKGRAEEVQKMDLLISTLKNQLSLSAKENISGESKMTQLQEDLKAVERERKETEEHLKGLHAAEVTDLRLMLSSQEATIECQRDEIQKLKELLSERPPQVNLKEGRFQRTTEEVKDLSEAGQQCLGEKHTYLIAKQRGVIAQLKQRISDLELVKPPVGSHQATLKELSRVRHELLKVKADSKSLVEPEKPEIDCTKTLLSYQVVTEPQDKSKEKHVLQQSEKSYIHLVSTICKQLPDVEKPVLSEFTTDSELKDRLELLKQRKQFADSVSKQLKIVQGCSTGSSEGSVSLSSQGQEQHPAEVIAQLESLLSATAEELEQQRRLNQALIKRKNFKDNQIK